MAAETNFGLSFGDPSKYIGQSNLAEVLRGEKKPGVGMQLLGHAINAFAGGSTDFGNKIGGNQPMFGAATAPQGSVPSPTSPAPSMAPAPIAPITGQQPQFAPQVNGQPMMTQPQTATNIQQQPVTQTPSYSRFLFSPQ